LDHGAQLNRAGRQWTALHYAVFAGHEADTHLLIEGGADIDARSTNGSTVLMMAAREGHEQLAQTVVQKGAKLELRNDRGEDALKWAIRHGNVRIAQMVAPPEDFAQAAREVAKLEPPPVRSVPAPKHIDTLLAEIRTARAQGRPINEV